MNVVKIGGGAAIGEAAWAQFAADLAELAALYAELGRVGEDARATAIRIVAQFTAHAAGSQPRLPVRRPRR